MKDQHKINVLAGIFAVSNMGQAMPSTQDIARIKSDPKVTLDASVMYFASSYIESDEHERIFEAEGNMWVEELTKMSDEEVAKTWPDVIAAYDAA